MINNEIFESAMANRNALIEKLTSMSINDMGVMKEELQNELENYKLFSEEMDFKDTEKKIRIGLYALKMKAVVTEEEQDAKINKKKPAETWSKTQKWLCKTSNRGIATIYSYMHIAKFSDALEFIGYTSTKLLKLTKSLSQYTEIMAMVDPSIAEMSFFSIKDLSSMIMKKLNIEKMDEFHNMIINNSSKIINLALREAAKGKSFENEINNLEEDVPYFVAKDMVRALTREVLDAKKVRKILASMKNKNNESETETKLNHIFAKIKELIKLPHTAENELKIIGYMDEMKSITKNLNAGSMENEVTAESNTTEGEAA